MKKIVAFVFVMLFLIGCGAKGEIYPATAILAGVDRCEHCNMLVPDDHNATQLILTDGRSLKFDDLGCMMEWVKENGLENVNVRYVRDFHTADWVILDNATFVYHQEFQTPMAYGVYSFSKKSDADAFVAEQGKGEVLSYELLEGHTWERDMEMMKKMKEEMGQHGHDNGENKEHGEKSEHGENKEAGLKQDEKTSH